MELTTTDESPSRRASERLFLRRGMIHHAQPARPGRPRQRITRLLTFTLSISLMLTAIINLRPDPASAAAFSPGDTLMVTTDALNLRAEPGLGGGVLAVLPYGSPLVLRSGPSSADGYAWYEVESPIDGTEADYVLGWVAADFVGDWVPSDNTGGFQAGMTVTVTTDALNLREIPYLSGSVLDVLPGGILATVLSGPYDRDGFLWYELNSYGTRGFAVAQYLSLATSSDQYPGGSTAVVNTDSLTLRTGPGLANAAIAYLSGGTSITILDGPVAADGYSWYNVDTAAYGAGWVCGECLAFADSPPAIEVGGGAYVVDGPLNFRSGPGLDAAVLDVIPDGTQFSVTDGPISANGYTWYQVHNIQYKSGWLAAEFLSAT